MPRLRSRNPIFKKLRPDLDDALIVVGLLVAAVGAMYVDPWLMLVVVGLLAATVGLVRAR